MDPLDRQIITLLRRDSRRSISSLSLELGVSRATINSRIERLESSGEIVGYTVVLKADALGEPVRGVTFVEITGQATDRVIKALSGFSEVLAIHTTNGKWDLVVELGASSLSDLDRVLGKFRQIQGIANSETNLLLATPLSTKARLGSDNQR